MSFLSDKIKDESRIYKNQYGENFVYIFGKNYKVNNIDLHHKYLVRFLNEILKREGVI